MPQVVYTNREIIISSFVVLACFLLSYFFPAQGASQNLFVLASFLVLVPLLYVKIILKKDISELGIELGSCRKGLISAGLSLMFSLMLIYVLFNYFDFLKTQNFLQGFKNNFGKFVVYEIFSVGILVAIFEFFFRGFVMKSFVPKFGYLAIVIQLVVFLAYALITKSLSLEMAYFPIIAFFSGIIVYFSRSLIYSIIYGWLFILIADAIAIRLLS